MIILDDVNLRKLQSMQLDIFKEFIRICKKYDFQYFLLGGSCLGAVRHQGFIPWDDDIDVGMPRDDYEKFLGIAEKELPKPYFLQTAETDPHYPLNFAKIRNSQTTFIESAVAHLQMNHGIYMDIFPMDGYSTSLLLKIRIKRYKWGIEKAFHLKEWRSKLKSMCVKISTATLKDYHKTRDRLDAVVKKNKYSDCDTVINHFGAWGDKEIFKKDILGQGSVGIFEGLEVVLPVDPDFYCRQMYGNYMEFPPIEKRVTHHHCTVIDLDQSYVTYCKSKDNES